MTVFVNTKQNKAKPNRTEQTQEKKDLKSKLPSQRTSYKCSMDNMADLPLSHSSDIDISDIFVWVMSLCDAKKSTTSRFSFLIGTISKRHQNGVPANKCGDNEKRALRKKKKHQTKTKCDENETRACIGIYRIIHAGVFRRLHICVFYDV